MFVSHLECPKCESTYESEQRIQLCKCGAPLLALPGAASSQAGRKYGEPGGRDDTADTS